MRLVYLDEIKGHEMAANNIIDIQGRLLIGKGARVKLSYLNKLLEAGINSIYIEDDISEGIEIESVLCEQTKQMGKIILESEMSRFMRKREIDLNVISKVSSLILNEILTNRTSLINAKDIKLKDELLFSHSINVCALTVFMCIKMGMEHSRIQSIGTGALLHDIGKMLIPSETLNKPGSLTKEEEEEMFLHPLFGYEALKDDVTVNPITKMVVYMHHEKIDGTGYPHGIKGDKIHESAKITAVCNAFDSLTTDKPYRKAHSIADVIEFLHTVSGLFYEKQYVDEFLKHIPMFPPGTIVLLNSGVIGIVVRNNENSFWRPVVRLLYNTKNKVKYGPNKEVDLMKDLTLKIEREVRYNQEG